jgi:glycosyltransferase involved in cell wall biosynthesis
MSGSSQIRAPRAVIVSTSLPRRCGLATFTNDLRTTLGAVAAHWIVRVCAIDRDRLRYGPEVMCAVRQDEPEDYRRAAASMARDGVDVVIFQHEYGIFGGPDGAHVLIMARELRRRGIPYLVTLHTVLPEPTRGQAATLSTLCRGAARVTVFTETARTLAAATGLADLTKLVVVPHGAPSVLREPVRLDRVGGAVRHALDRLDGSRVLSTFGLIGPGKGLDHAIEALPPIVAKHPDVCYVIAGATHPEVIRVEGESYRRQLSLLAESLGVRDNVHFIDAFLTDAELAALLSRTEIYVTPYRSPDQICSGTLTFAIAAGRPIVSTAYRYAVDLLGGGPGHVPGTPSAGVLVPCGDVDALAETITELLTDEPRMAAMRAVADELGATLTWPSVAQRFAEVFAAARVPHPAQVGPAADAGPGLGALDAGKLRPFPLLLTHLDRLADDIGIVQFAAGDHPDTDSGYCVDDVARLAIVACGLTNAPLADDPRPARWLHSSLRFLGGALTETGSRNLLSYAGHWEDEPHVGDHLGRAIWALGVVASGAPDAEARVLAHRLLERTPALADLLIEPRSAAYAILGLTRLDDDADPAVQRAARLLAHRLADAVEQTPEWCWFEPRLTYDNARLPQALLAAGARLNDPALTALGLSTLDWYLDQVGLHTDGPGVLRLVGNKWRTRSRFSDLLSGHEWDEGDEQPLDAAAVVEALVQAWLATSDPRYSQLAGRAFGWFYGVNRPGVMLYDLQTGACRDGLTATGVNANSGAESTLAYYQALLAVADAGLVDTVDLWPPATAIAAKGPPTPVG